MSIRLIAKDLYELIRKVENLEKEIDDTPYENQSDMKDQLRKLRAKRNHMRKVLEGCKDPK
jgi:protein-arginine kinase activator protein McsA